MPSPVENADRDHPGTRADDSEESQAAEGDHEAFGNLVKQSNQEKLAHVWLVRRSKSNSSPTQALCQIAGDIQWRRDEGYG